MNLISLTPDDFKEFRRYCVECTDVASIILQLGDEDIHLCAGCFCDLKEALK